MGEVLIFGCLAPPSWTDRLCTTGSMDFVETPYGSGVPTVRLFGRGGRSTQREYFFRLCQKGRRLTVRAGVYKDSRGGNVRVVRWTLGPEGVDLSRLRRHKLSFHSDLSVLSLSFSCQTLDRVAPVNVFGVWTHRSEECPPGTFPFNDPSIWSV